MTSKIIWSMQEISVFIWGAGYYWSFWRWLQELHFLLNIVCHFNKYLLSSIPKNYVYLTSFIFVIIWSRFSDLESDFNPTVTIFTAYSEILSLQPMVRHQFPKRITVEEKISKIRQKTVQSMNLLWTRFRTYIRLTSMNNLVVCCLPSPLSHGSYVPWYIPHTHTYLPRPLLKPPPDTLLSYYACNYFSLHWTTLPDYPA